MNADPLQAAVDRFGVSEAEPHVAGLDLIGQYATDPPRVIEALIDAAPPVAASGRICELGFGTGWLLQPLADAFPRCELFGVDLSPAFARRARDLHGRDVAVMLGDMQRLPFGDGAFDVVYTCWTLYFMPDIGAVLDEARRTLRPGGRLIAATNARDHMLEYAEIASEALRRVLGRDPETDMAERFDLVSGGPLLRAHFDAVTTVLWEGEMLLRDASHARLLWDAYGTATLLGEERQHVIDEVVKLVDERIRRDGVFRMRRRGGAFVGSRAGS